MNWIGGERHAPTSGGDVNTADDWAEEAHEARKRDEHCRCGNPDLPGHCPGWWRCPMQERTEDE